MNYTYNRDTLQILPIGGVGEFGMNSMLIRHNDTIVIVDAGVMFPDTDLPGVDLVVPDFEFLKELNLAHLVRAIVITHGHEDHIGGVPFLCHALNRDVDVYATRLTIGFIKRRMEEHDCGNDIRFHEMKAGETLTFDALRIHPLQVTHSIVDAVALAIESPAGNIFHTGDFKIDQTPIDGKPFDFAGFTDWGRKGIDLLMSDSTNVSKGGFTLSESTVGQSLERIIGECRQKVVVACFSSHIHRIQQIIRIARDRNRKVVLMGRSLENAVGVARSLGYLDVPPDVVLNRKDIRDIPEHRLIVITTGSQGEPMAALSRLVRGEMKEVELYPEDTVIISAKTIPGNEKQVTRVINNLYRLGTRVHYEEVSEVHVSGHASREELKMVFSLLKPRQFIPIHGARKQLEHHAKLAREMGLLRRDVHVIENGDLVELRDGHVRQTGTIDIQYRYIEGERHEELEGMALRDRRRLSEDGLIIVTLLVEERTGQLVGDVEVITRGFVLLSDDEDEMAMIRDVVRERFESLEPEERWDWEHTRPKIRSALRSYFRKRMKTFPVVLPIILSVPDPIN